MIDFPNAPVDGQIFVAPNGVSYRWVAATGLWVTAAGTTPGGDFFANNSATVSLTGSAAPILFNTVVTGNAGSWYNPATGRFTPPPGRYNIWAGFSGYNSGGTTGSFQIFLRKNGVAIINGNGTTGAGAVIPASVQGEFDANGTDYFDIAGLTAASTGTAGAGQAWFGAFPITGIQGPAGPPGGGWRVLQRTVVSSAQANVNIQSIPSDVNEIEVHFDLLPATNDVDLLCSYFGATGTLDSTTGHYSQVVWTLTTGGGAGSPVNGIGNNTGGGIFLTYSATGVRVNTTAGGGIKGSFKIIDIRNTTTRKALVGQAYFNDATSGMRAVSFFGDRNVLEAITGLQLAFSTGNVASGSFEVWGSP